MGAVTAIGWTDHTFNPWWGCARVSPGCEHCYAEAWARRTGYGNPSPRDPARKPLPLLWGAAAERRTFGAQHWAEPRRWNAAARAAGRIDRVFCASMADVFEDHPAVADARHRLRCLIAETPYLIWQLLTKRPENVREMVPPFWLDGNWPDNVWLGVTTEDQRRADARLAHATAIGNDTGAVIFASYEPALERVRFDRWKGQELDWIIVGGESGPGARPFDLDWARSAIDDARTCHAAPFVKQLGSVWARAERGRHPHGADPAQWPEPMRVQEFPC